MPIYEYECEAHGSFELLRSISEHEALGSCPACECAAPRVVSTPRLAAVSRATRIAHERNERSCHEPRMALASGGERGQRSAARPALRRYGGPRSWVIEHG